ncbi:hypothetical protein NIES2109_19790 [Nostoc sp. HK-01]|nr:hypothetical protein NIES2109_19790 [Nostoc sp. HK-01]
MFTQNAILLFHFGVFRKQNLIMLAQYLKMLSHFSKSRTHFGVFRKQNLIMFAQYFKMLSHFSKLRTYEKYYSVAKVITDLPEFSQAEEYGYYLR